jgi:hypothetical protein
MVHWKEIALWNLDNELIADETRRIPLLRKYRTTGDILAWRVDPSGYDESGNPLSGTGPDIGDAGPRVAEIDWSGLPEGWYAFAKTQNEVALGGVSNALAKGTRRLAIHGYSRELTPESASLRPVANFQAAPERHRAALEAGTYARHGYVPTARQDIVSFLIWIRFCLAEGAWYAYAEKLQT